LVKSVKVGILLAIVAQTLTPWDVLPLLADPGSLRAAGLILFTAGLAIALLGRLQLGSNWADIETAQVLTKQQVVCRGLYRYIRHPIYSGDLLLLFGLQMALNSWGILLVAAMAPVVLMQAVREESLLRESLPGYGEYCRTTKRFVPFVI
jgi:protein-S-isoprenylcysteine O-methyltransferase Ste14